MTGRCRVGASSPHSHSPQLDKYTDAEQRAAPAGRHSGGAPHGSAVQRAVAQLETCGTPDGTPQAMMHVGDVELHTRV